MASGMNIDDIYCCFMLGGMEMGLIFLLSAQVQVMELSVSGRSKLADVLGGGRLVKLLVVFPGILCLICIS